MDNGSDPETPQLPEAVVQRVSANLREAREDAGLSIEELAARCDLHPAGVERVERGVTLPRLDTLVKLAGALDIRPAELCAGVVWDIERRRFE